jgi:hypothetical protein
MCRGCHSSAIVVNAGDAPRRITSTTHEQSRPRISGCIAGTRRSGGQVQEHLSVVARRVVGSPR